MISYMLVIMLTQPRFASKTSKKLKLLSLQVNQYWILRKLHHPLSQLESPTHHHPKVLEAYVLELSIFVVQRLALHQNGVEFLQESESVQISHRTLCDIARCCWKIGWSHTHAHTHTSTHARTHTHNTTYGGSTLPKNNTWLVFGQLKKLTPVY